MFSRLRSTSIASASLLLMVSMTVVNAGNYVYNLIMGRWLGPILFADISLIVTLLLVVTFITVPLQLTTARYAAIAQVDNDWVALATVRQYLTKIALLFGFGFAAVFSFGSSWLAAFFHTQSSLPFIIFGCGLPFSLMQGVNRGVFQGKTRFGVLAITYQVEMWSRLLFGVALVALGLSVNGAVLGISLSFVATWLSTLPARRGLPEPINISQDMRRAVIGFSIPVLVAQIAQILINNSDILLVRRFFQPADAGQYAALALTGRIVFFATWSVVTTMFPIVAQRHKQGAQHRHLLWLSLLIVGGIAIPVVLLASVFPELIVKLLFGDQYLGIAPLLWLYALATTLYAMANVVINYRLSLGMGKMTGFAIGAGAAQVIGIILFHVSLAEVVWVQVIIMGALFLLMLIFDIISERKKPLPDPQN